MTRVRVALWGVGPHASRKILPAIAAAAGTELAGITTRNVEVAAREAERFGCPVFASPEAMLASGEVDAVYLSTPIGLHHRQGRDVLLAGKHLWCEKSLTASRGETDDLAELSRDRNLTLCEAFMFAYHPQFERLREIVSSGQGLGDLVSITCRFGMEFQSSPGFRHSAELGGGALLDVACYPLSLALRLGDGDPRVVHHRVHRVDGYEVDVAGDALLEFPSGALAFLEWGFGRGYVNEAMLWGTRGAIRAPLVFSKPPGYTATLEHSDIRGAREIQSFEPADSYVRMLDTFARATRDGTLQEQLRVEAQRQAAFLDRLR